MDAEMQKPQVEENGEHRPPLEDFHASNVICDEPPVAPCIGSEHQAEIPNLATDDERYQIMASSLYSCHLHGHDHPSAIELAIPIVWGSHPPSEVKKTEDILQTPHCPETESRDSNIDMMQQRETAHPASQPGLSSSVWNDLEEESFLLGLYIFGKNLSMLSKFVGRKTVGETISYYYGRFYNRNAYKRWSHCRKTKTNRCILGERIFTGRRQHELISRLKTEISKEAHDSIVEVMKSFSDRLQVMKSFSDRLTSLEKCIFTLKDTIGLKAFVEMIGIGKGKHDLTGFVQDTSKINHVKPKGVTCSSLAIEDIIKYLTGDFRRSKAKSNDNFWEAVWPRLLARGWHSEQPKDVRTTKNCLVYLVPGIKEFSRRKLTKGTHYSDSVTDVLKKVVADPSLLRQEADGVDNRAAVLENSRSTDQDSPLDGYQELPNFTVIDTTLVEKGEPFKVRMMRSLPADANICIKPSHHPDNLLSDSSSQEQDGDDSLSDGQDDHGRVTARVNDTGMVLVHSTAKESHVDMFENMETKPFSAFPVNGHSSEDQHTDFANRNRDKTDLASFSGVGPKPGRRVYLSPKRKRLARCSSDQVSPHNFLFPNDGGSVKHKRKLISTSSKPAVLDLGDNFRTRTLTNCYAQEKQCESLASVVKRLKPPTSVGSHEKRNVANIKEDKLFEGKVDTVTKIHRKIDDRLTVLTGMF